MRNALGSVLTVAVSVLTASAVDACPLCESGTGAAVRAGITADFAAHLGATAAPFVVLAGVVTIVQRGWPPWGDDA